MKDFIPTEESEESLLMHGREFATRDGVTYVEVEEAGETHKPITNYEKLFGTPERAAKTMDARCERSCVCDMCAYCAGFCTTSESCHEGVTKWLNQEASNDRI